MQQIGAAQRDSILLYRTSGQKWNHVNRSGEKYHFHYCKYDRSKNYGKHSSYAKPPIPAKEEDSHKHNLIALLDAKTHTRTILCKKTWGKGDFENPTPKGIFRVLRQCPEVIEKTRRRRQMKCFLDQQKKRSRTGKYVLGNAADGHPDTSHTVVLSSQ